MSVKPPIRVERYYQCPIEKVWETVTKQQYLALWLMPGNFKAEKGHQYFFQCSLDEHGWDGKIFGEVLEVKAPYLIRFSWNTQELHKSTIVTFRLEETDQGIRFSIAHDGFAKADQASHAAHAEGWMEHIIALEKYLTDGAITH